MEFTLMTNDVPDILSRIVEHKRAELASVQAQRPDLERQAEDTTGSRRDFFAALASRFPAIIAEIKKASPSKGVLAEDFQPVSIAKSYQEGGAAAVSVLTEERFFQGSLADLVAVRSTIERPVLRKDFTIDECHVIEAAAHGADAILLIAAILTADEMRRLRGLAVSYRMAVLVEVRDQPELEAALDAGAVIIGVNNRNLNTFEVNLETSLRLSEHIPDHIIKVSESGIHSPADISRLREAGFHAFLVGEHLMNSADPAEALRALTS